MLLKEKKMQISRAWAEIDRQTLQNNFLATKEKTNARILAMVKANAYGHGAVEAAKVFSECGAFMLGVACAAEALALRAGGITAPVLIAGYVPESEIETALSQDARITVSSFSEAEVISHVAQKCGKTAVLHIKADTGMHRLGFLTTGENAVAEALRIFSLPHIAVEGVFTHFPCADAMDAEVTKTSFNSFLSFATAIEEASGKALIKHAANSAAIFRFPEMHLDMVRAGICLYGDLTLPCGAVPKIQEAMTVKATVGRVAKISKGETVGYGATFKAAHDMQIATVLIGYGDGMQRALSNRGFCIVKGKKVPIVGRICMDQLMLDVTGIDVKTGDVATIRGREGENAVTTRETAEMLGTISYEVFCNLGERIPRIYV